MTDDQPRRPPPAGISRRLLSRGLSFALGIAVVLVASPSSPQQTDAAQGGAAEADELEAAAQAAPVAPPSDVEVIRIKGRGVAAIETDVPESVTQFDSATIEALGAQNISDLAKVTPNVEIRTAGATAATFFIRGVGLSDFSSNAAGAVAIYQDGVAMNSPAIQLGQLFDIENVEILRGPQGGGSDRNASAGAIKAYSRRPTGQYEAQLRTGFGAYGSDDSRNGLIQDYEGALEIPLVDETLAARFAFRFFDADPYMTNGCGNAPPDDQRTRARNSPRPRVPIGAASICGERSIQPASINNPDRGLSPIETGLPTAVLDRHNWAARGQLRFQPPGSEMDWLLNLHGSRLNQDSTLGQAIGTGSRGDEFGSVTSTGYVEPDQGEEFCALLGASLNTVTNLCTPPSPPAAEDQARAKLAKNLAEDRPLDIRPYRGDYDKVGQTTLDTWGGFLRGDIPIGPVNFTNISAYDRYDRFRDSDNDFTPDVLFETVNEDSAWQFSQELRFTGELPDTPLRWEAGGYYLMEQLQSEIFLEIGGLSNLLREYQQDLYSFAFYGGFSWDFLDDFTLEGGVRYNWERKTFDFVETSVDIPNIPSRPADGAKTWTAPTGTISLTYRIREDISAYWKYGRGFKAGHFNANPNAQLSDDKAEPARPEFIDAFETGLRGRWFDGRFAMGGALFYYKYVDYQVFIFEDNPGTPPTLEIINADDAEVYGAELDARIEPLVGWVPSPFEGLVITTRFSWLESQFLDFTNTVFREDALSQNIPVVVDFSGNQLINSPRFKVSGAVEWTFDLGRWGQVIPRYDFAWSDDVFFDPSEGRGSLGFDSQPNKPDFAVGQPAFWLHNLRLSYRTPAGNMEIAGWVRNLMDTRYKSYAFDASFFSKVVINFVGEPRTFGADLSIRW
jgi:outer membrane receptor protein involved in Fe transport